MNATWVVFRKELRDTLRDRRTLFAMVVVPVLLFPLLMIGMAKFSQSRAEEVQSKVLQVAVADYDGVSGVAEHLRKEPGLAVVETLDTNALPARVRDETLDAAVIVLAGYRQAQADRGTAQLQLIHKSSDDFGIRRKRVEDALGRFEKGLLDARLAGLGMRAAALDPIAVELKDEASDREKEGLKLGGLLPYLFIIFCFTGSMYPAIDLAAGEKERGTLETLLSSPASRLQIAAGKFAVVVLTGLASALLAMVSLYVSVDHGSIPPEMRSAISTVLAPATLGLLVVLLVPLSVFFAAVLLMLSLYARSYKEAMSIISPLMIVVIVPAVIALAPGVRLGPATAAIPVLNVSLATREVIAGTAEPAHLALVFASLVALAAAGLWACARWFSREDVVFRS